VALPTGAHAGRGPVPASLASTADIWLSELKDAAVNPRPAVVATGFAQTSPSSVTFTLSSSGVALYVQLDTTLGGVFDDNGFTLLPWEPRTLTFTSPRGGRVGAAALKDGQLDAAEQRFRTYLDKHPKDRLSADATFYLGESYFRRSRPREAAEQYLKVSTDFPKASRAPESLVKLGLSLEKLGAKEQACAAFGEVGRKYPSAAPTVRASAEREIKRAQC
jgi:tol-pal system protein YbgF